MVGSVEFKCSKGKEVVKGMFAHILKWHNAEKEDEKEEDTSLDAHFTSLYMLLLYPFSLPNRH